MSIDWGNELDKVEQATKPISEGTHTFRIVEAKPTKAQSSGNPMIRLNCKVEGGPDDAKTAFVNLVFSFENPRAMKMTLKRLTGLGINGDMLKAENPSVEQIAGKLIGRSAQGTVTHREWNGEIQNDVDFVAGSPSAGVPDAPSVPKPDVPEAVDVPTAAAPAAAAETPPTPSVPEEAEAF